MKRRDRHNSSSIKMKVLSVLIVLLACQRARACSDFLLNATFGTGCMSGRTMDFETDLNHEVGFMPKGRELAVLPIYEGCPPGTLKTEHSFAFLMSARNIFQSISKEIGVAFDDVAQVFSDGLNDVGLSVTVQWDYNVPGLPNATECNMTNAVSALDLSTYILASFSTVQEVREALNPAGFTVVNFQLPPKAMSVLLNSGLLAPGGYPLIHLGLHDASHDSLVIEFEGSPRGFALRENPVGVLTNEPQLPGHYEQLGSYLRERFQVPQLSFQDFKPGTYDPVNYDSTFYAPPGDHSSQSRFIRLAMLNQVAGLRSWPVNESWSPAGNGPSKGLWVAAENILNTIVLPPAIDDAGGAGSKNYDYTQVSILRDHDNLLYYFRSPAAPQWQMVDVGSSASAVPLGALRILSVGPLFKTVPVRHNYIEPWYTDISSILI